VVCKLTFGTISVDVTMLVVERGSVEGVSVEEVSVEEVSVEEVSVEKLELLSVLRETVDFMSSVVRMTLN
jgi:hypothetical protein